MTQSGTYIGSQIARRRFSRHDGTAKAGCSSADATHRFALYLMQCQRRSRFRERAQSAGPASVPRFREIVAESRSTAIVEVLRGRFLRGLQAGVLEPGERLPSARELVSEFHVDHRFIVAAYRQLEDEGLVTIRERGGVYIAANAANRAGLPALPVKWFVDMLCEAFAHEIAAPELHEWLRRSIETLRLRAAVISTTPDQVAGLTRELRDDFGLAVDGFTGLEIDGPSPYPASLRRADLIVATATGIEVARSIADELRKPLLEIDVRPHLGIGEWALLLRKRVWAVVASAAHEQMLRELLGSVRGVENLCVLVLDRDDLSSIPDGAPTYATHHVREKLAGALIRGRFLPAARAIAPDSARALFDFIVRANLASISAVHGAQSAPSRALPLDR
jgi:DNA-binding transcriptional regulator YhcF (GntR family)